MAGHKAKLRVLLITHDGFEHDSAKLLQNHGNLQIVGEVKTVGEAVKAFKEESVDFFIIENGISQSQSTEMIKQLKRECSDIPLIVMSGQAEEIFIAEVLNAGASGYIIKQNINQELTDAILRIEHGQTYLSPLVSKSISMILEMEKNHSFNKNLDNGMEIEQLTDRQKEILKLLVQGLTNKQVAQQLKLSVKTVDAHRANIMNKLKIHGLPGLVKYAIRTGLTTVEE